MYSYAALILAVAIVATAAAGAYYVAWADGWATHEPPLRWKIRAFVLFGFLGGAWIGWFGMFGPGRSRGTTAVFPVALLAVVGFSLLYSQVIIWIGKRVPKA